MIKTGRPKKTNKAAHRTHSVVLTEKAEITFRQICKRRGRKDWFHRYVSEHLINDFPGGEKAYLLHLLKRKQAEASKAYEESRDIAKKINELDMKKRIQDAEKEIKRVI